MGRPAKKLDVTSFNYLTEINSVLKIDFPRVPFINNKRGFKKLSGLGEQLVSCHILNNKVKNLKLIFLKKVQI